MSAERIIGIDFGTSTSFVKVKRYEDGKPVGGDRYETKAVVFDGNGSIAVPTVLQRAGEQYWFGYDAESLKPGGTVYRNFKVDLESSDAEKRETARSLTKQFFKYIYQKYDEQRQFFGDKTDTEKTLVSYPAKWSDETGLFMVEAAKEAGFQNVSGIDEATAAINVVMVQKADELQEKGYLQADKPVTLMLIDMGAGTTDMAVCRYTTGSTPKNEIIATWPKADGDILFGGREVDEILCGYLSEKLTENGMMESVVRNFSKQRIGEIKAWKEYTVSDTLSRDGKVEYCTVLDGLYMLIGITPPPFAAIGRKSFEKMMEDYLKKFAVLVNGCLEYAKDVQPDFEASDISLVVLTGGHSQWYFAEQILTGQLESLGEVDLPMLQNDVGRILRMARPQETVSMGLVYKIIVPENRESGKLNLAGRDIEYINRKRCNRETGTDGVSGMFNIYPLETKDGWIYYCNENDNMKLYKMRIDKSMNTKIIDSRVGEFAVIGEWIYYSNWDDIGKIYKIRADGMLRTKLIDDRASEPVFEGNNIYYNNISDNNCLYKVSIDGSIRERITSEEVHTFMIRNGQIYYIDKINRNLYSIQTNGSSMKLTDHKVIFYRIVDDWIYYRNESDSQRLYKIRYDGTLRTRLTNESVNDFKVSGDWVYYSNIKDTSKPGSLFGRIYKIRTDGNMRTKITNDETDRDFIIANDWIYYRNLSDNKTLYKMNIERDKRIQITKDMIGYFEIQGDWVYYINLSDSERLYKIRTDGTMKVKLSDDHIFVFSIIADEVIKYSINKKDNKGYQIRKDGTEKKQFNMRSV